MVHTKSSAWRINGYCSSERLMRVVLQRVTSGSVRVEGEIVGQIGKGLVCLVGVGRQDTEEDAEFCCRRLLVSICTTIQ